MSKEPHSQNPARVLPFFALAVLGYLLSGGLIRWAFDRDLLEWVFKEYFAANILKAYTAPLDWLYQNIPWYTQFIDWVGT